MKKTLINASHIEGLLYQHALELKVTGDTSKNPGTKFISGTIDIATDDACLNIVPVHFTYVTATTAKGKSNATFGILQNIIDGKIANLMDTNKESAARLRIDSAVGLNEFFSDRNGNEELISVKRNEGGFVHTADTINDDEKQRNTFKCDMIITNCVRMDADEERNTPDRVIVKGAIFDFRKALLPVEFTAVNPGAIKYFEGLEVSPKAPIFTCVWGRQISETVIKTITEESAFGEASVREVRSSRKDWVITGAAKEAYPWDDDSSITAAELNEAMATRETYLATLKQRNDEYKASQGKAPSAAVETKGFNF